MQPQPDSTALVTSARNGDPQAFERLVGMHYDFIFRVAFKWCRNRTDAEDIAQDACIRLARSISGYSGKAAFTSWLYRLVIHAAIDWQRKNDRPRDDSMHEQADQAPSAENQLYAREMLALVDRLPVKEKTALLLVHAEGLSHGEAAKIMETKESTVSWYIHEARKKLDSGQEERRHG
jgi:RNA polymerase sigma-70 factor (ECF subfamily)